MRRIFMVGFSTNKGGVESYISNLCGTFAPEDFEVVFHWPEMIINGKKWITPQNRHNYIKYCLFWYSFFKENKFDVLYYNTCDIVSIDMLKFAKVAGVPVRIIHAHSTQNQRKLSFFHKLMENKNRKIIDQYATQLFACSKGAGDWMFPKKQFTIIKNGIQINKYLYNQEYRKECRRCINLGEDDILIGSVGRLEYEKNPMFSIELMKQIIETKKNVHFVYIGDGKLKDTLMEQVIENQFEKNIYLLGARDDVNKWYSALDCLIMPSLFEGLPFTLIEAQAAGLPCVVSSTVSEDANITGLIDYIRLDAEKDIWINKIIDSCRKEKVDVTEKLVDAGYSIEDTALFVANLIKK